MLRLLLSAEFSHRTGVTQVKDKRGEGGNELHNFICTDKDVVAFVFAPESGDGPTDEVNPLQARTILGRTR